MQVVVFILVLLIAAYLAMFSLANDQLYELNLTFYGGKIQNVAMWQVIAAAVVAGVIIGMLLRSAFGSRGRERLRASEHQLRQALNAAEDCRKRLASLEAENERLRGRTPDAAEERKAGPDESDAAA